MGSSFSYSGDRDLRYIYNLVSGGDVFMDTATQIERLKQLEETINQRFEEQLRKRDYITYQEFLDEFINPFFTDRNENNCERSRLGEIRTKFSVRF